MALPVTISGAQFPAQNYYCGPFKAPNGNFYLVLLNAGGTPEVYKATDPTDSFSAQDAANNPTAVPTAMAADLLKADLIIATASVSSPHIQFHRFSTTSDTWTTADETIEALADSPGSANLSVAIAARSDGDIIVLYNGNTDNVMGSARQRVDYARNEGSGWTAGIAVDAGGSVSYIAGSAVRGALDKIHFFFTNGADGDVLHRSLSSSNTLGTEHTVDSGTGSTIVHKASEDVYYDDAIERITVTYGEGTNTLSSVVIENDGTPATPKTITTGVKVVNGSPVACIAADHRNVVVLYAQNSDSDLFTSNNNDNETNWATPTEQLDAVTVNRISCNRYTRQGGNKIAYVYDDGGTVKYNEMALTAPTAPSFAATQVPNRQYRVGPFREDI